MKFIGVVIMVVLFASCNEQRHNPQTTEVSVSLRPEYASHFTIERHDSYKQLKVIDNAGAGQTYILYSGEQPVIDIENAIYIKTPVKSVACLSSLYVGFLDRLHLTEKVSAVDNIDYIANPAVRKGVESGKIKELARSGNLNEELTLALHPDLIFTYGTGSADKENNKKIKLAGIPIVYCIDNRENSALGRAEWIKFLACFFDAEASADSLFNQTRFNYLRLKDSAATAMEFPTVLTEIKLNDAWYVPGGKSYMAGLISDAHASYCWKTDSTERSLPLSFEEVYKKGASAEYWINLGFCNSKSDLLKLDKRYAEFTAFKNGNVYNYNARQTAAGGNELWETGIIMPDLILRDLIKVFHPQKFQQEAFVYYHKLK